MPEEVSLSHAMGLRWGGCLTMGSRDMWSRNT